MLQLNVKNETSRLRAVVLGSAEHNGHTPTTEETYDPKSLEHILAGTYPVEADMVNEMEAFNQGSLSSGLSCKQSLPSTNLVTSTKKGRLIMLPRT